MFRFLFNPMRITRPLSVLLLLALAIALPSSSRPQRRRRKPQPPPKQPVGPRKFPFDPTKLVWPSPPNIARVRWVDYFAGAKIDYTPAATTKPKATWMDRLAGGQSQAEKFNPKTFPFQLIGPYGIAIDSKGLVYVADQKVGAIFIFNPRNPRYPAHPQWL